VTAEQNRTALEHARRSRRDRGGGGERKREEAGEEDAAVAGLDVVFGAGLGPGGAGSRRRG